LLTSAKFSSSFELAHYRLLKVTVQLAVPATACYVCVVTTHHQLHVTHWWHIGLSSRTRMWANAQRDGHPAEYRWRPLFNATKFGWRPH